MARFTLGSGGLPTGPALLFAPGFVLVGIGAAILLLPQLLAYLVAGCFLMAGAALLGAAWQMRRGSGSRGLVGFLDRLRGANHR
ncbi:MAG: hypothetical protein HZB39_03320 [Planctomycetes bacterium]|nr:hypothetical protein [Planctomycetota bacterium]